MTTSDLLGAEGVVAKRLDSRYLPGRRSPQWIKVKKHRDLEVIIGGWRPGLGRRSSTVGSLLLGVPGPVGLNYVGHVGTGFTGQMLDDLIMRLRPLQTHLSPFAERLPPEHARDAQWVHPELVAEVVYAHWTPDNMLRHAVWRGLRLDKNPADVG